MPSKGFVKKTGQNAQVGLEYLITYGWALVAIATIIGVLIFAVGGGVNTASCNTFLKFVCKGINADGDTLVMVLQNATGQKISITPFEGICFDGQCGYATIEYQGSIYRFETVEIGAGEQFTIFGTGQALANQVSITYTERTTGLEQTENATIRTGTQPGIEISNDGIDNDGIDGIDCADPDLIAAGTKCEYVVENGIPSATDIPLGSNITITFSKPIATADWVITKTIIAFYHPDGTVGTGAQARINFALIESDPVTVQAGWNFIEISVPLPGITLESANVFELSAIGSDITISNEEGKRPKAIVTLKPD